MRSVLLVVTVVFLAVAALLTVRSIRRDDALDGLGALVSMLGAAAPAAAYGALAA